MAFEDVELLTDPTYKSMRFDGTFDHYLILANVANGVLAAGKLGRIESRCYQDAPGSTQYIVTLVNLKNEESMVSAGVWVVLTSNNTLEVYYDDKYRERLTLPAGEE